MTLTKQTTSLTQGEESIEISKIDYTKICFIGDSLTDQTERGPSLVTQLETYLAVRGPVVKCRSAAVGGSMFKDAITGQINTAKSQSQVDIAVALNAAIVCVNLGFNDAFNSTDSAAQIIQAADALFNEIRTRLPSAHIVYIEEVPYDRRNVGLGLTGLTNKNVMPFLQEGQTLFGQPNVVATNTEFLDAPLTQAKIDRVAVWNQVTEHVKAQNYIDSTMEFDMFFLARCGMHTDLIHLDVYGYKMFALDVRKHFMNTPAIINGITNYKTSRLQPVFSDDDDVNPNLMNGTEGLRGAFNVIGTGVNARYEFKEDFIQIGFTNHDYYPFSSRQYIWPFRNRNVNSNIPSQAAYRNVPIAFDITNAIVDSDVFINWDNNDLVDINRVVDAGCTIFSVNRLNSFFPVGDFTQGMHTISYALRYQDSRIEMYERPIEIVNSGDDPDWVVGGSSLTAIGAQGVLSGTFGFAPGGSTQNIPADVIAYNNDNINITASTNGGFEIAQGSNYTQFKVSGCMRVTGATATGVFALQAVLNGELPASATIPIAIDSGYFVAGNAVVLSFSTLWINLPQGMDNVIELEASGPNGGTVQGSNQTWLAIEVR